jgi:hypothetical protein
MIKINLRLRIEHENRKKLFLDFQNFHLIANFLKLKFQFDFSIKNFINFHIYFNFPTYILIINFIDYY